MTNQEQYELFCEKSAKYDKMVENIEPLTDTEQRIFLAAMVREEQVCKKVDKEFRDGEKLVPVCQTIKRKIIRALFE